MFENVRALARVTPGDSCDRQSESHYIVGNVGEGAVVQQRERLSSITLQLPGITDAASAKEVIDRLQKEIGQRRSTVRCCDDAARKTPTFLRQLRQDVARNACKSVQC